MRKFLTLFVLFMFFINIHTGSSLQSKIMYLQTVESYSSVEGEIFRWNSERELIYYGHSLELDENNDTVVNVELMDENTYGQVENVIFPYRSVNFVMTIDYLENGTLKNIGWSIIPVRDAETGGNGQEPFTIDERFVLTTKGARRFDLKSNTTFFSVNLQYTEFIEIKGLGLQAVRTSTELSTNNNGDGTIIRSSLHVIKRLSDSQVILDYNEAIQQVNSFARFYNFLDKPFLAVPFQFLIVLIIIWGYNKLYKFRKMYQISIQKIEINDSSE